MWSSARSLEFIHFKDTDEVYAGYAGPIDVPRLVEEMRAHMHVDAASVPS